MKRTFLLVLAVLAFAGPATAAAPAKQPVVPGFFHGKTIGYYDFGPIKLKPGNKLAPIWTVTNGARGSTTSSTPSPGKRLHAALAAEQSDVQAGRHAALAPLTQRRRSRPEGRRGDDRRDEDRRQLPGARLRQKRVAGYSAGKTIHYYDLGPVKVAPGNVVLPLVTITNGVCGPAQHHRREHRTGSHRLPAALGNRQGHLGGGRAQALAHLLRASQARRESRRGDAREDHARRQLPPRLAAPRRARPSSPSPCSAFAPGLSPCSERSLHE